MAPSTAPKTYFVLRSLDYRPEDLIQLGQVIENPMTPYVRLARPLPLTGAIAPRKSSSSDWSMTLDNKKDSSIGVFARVADMLSVEAKGTREGVEILERAGAVLETQYIEITEDPSYIDQTFKLPEVHSEVTKLRNICDTFFMVTGLKVVNFPGEASTESSRSRTATASAAAGSEGVQGGLEGQIQKSKGNRVTETPDGAYIVAYRLRELRVSWRRKRLRVGREVGGADLSGRGREGRGSSRAMTNDDTDVWEIGEIEVDPGDFGPSLRMVNPKKAVDEEDGAICFIMEAVTP